MDLCNRCEYETINESNQQTHNVDILLIDVTDMNIKLKIRVINRHIISYIIDGCNRYEYKATTEH